MNTNVMANTYLAALRSIPMVRFALLPALLLAAVFASGCVTEAETDEPSSASTSSSGGGAGGQGGDGGSGGQTSTSTTTSSSSAGGEGGAGGQGGSEPCVPVADPCSMNAIGACQPMDDGCGHQVSCEALGCGVDNTDKLICDKATYTCACQPAEEWPQAVSACVGKGSPRFCGSSSNEDTPSNCTKTNVDLGAYYDVWCCQ